MSNLRGSSEAEQLRELLMKSETELFIKIGSEESGLNAIGPITDPMAAGRAIVTRAWNWFGNSICSSPTVKDAVTKDDLLSIALAIVPLIPEANPYTDSIVLSALFAKVGIKRLCADQWNLEPE